MRIVVMALATLSLSSTFAWGQGLDENGTLSLIVENDVFADRDEQYTNGVKLSWLSPERELPEFLRPARSIAEPLIGSGEVMRWGIALGQSLYTPDNTDLVVPDPTDRPYAAWLHAALSLVSYTKGGDSYWDRLDTVELHLGVVGPSALGEEVQNGFHDWIGDGDAKGWDHQLEDEPGIMLLADRHWQSPPLYLLGDLGIDFAPNVSIALGNVQTYAALGGTLRLGQGLGADFGAPRIRPALSGSAFYNSGVDWAWYFFAGVEGRAVAQDIFLDGNTWRDSPSVDKNWAVGDVQAGIALILAGVRVTYSYVRRTEEFDGQDEDPQFGAVSISLNL